MSDFITAEVERERIAALEAENAGLRTEYAQMLAEVKRRFGQVMALRSANERMQGRLDEQREMLGAQSDAIIELASKVAGVDPTTPVSEIVRLVAQKNPTFSQRVAASRTGGIEL